MGRELHVAIKPSHTKDEQIGVLVDAGRLRLRSLLQLLGRDELKAACRAHGLDDSGRSRPALAARLLEAHGQADSVSPKPLFAADEIPTYAPTPATSRRCDIASGSSRTSSRRRRRATSRA